MKTLLKSTLRVISKRKAETIAIVVLGALAVGFLLGIQLDSWNFQEYMKRSMVDTLGHVSYFGEFDESVLQRVEKVPGVSKAELYYWAPCYSISSNNSKYRVILLDDRLLNNPLIEGNATPVGEKAVLYLPAGELAGPQARIPSSINVTLYNAHSHTWEQVRFEIAGLAKGLPGFSSQARVILLVDHRLLAKYTNNKPTWLAVWVENPVDEEIDHVAGQIRSILEEDGYVIRGEWINYPQHNPAAATIKSVADYLTPYVFVAILLVAILTAAGGASTIESSTRHIAVLRSLGATRREVLAAYIAPWALRIITSMLAGVLLGPIIGKLILKIVMRGNIEVLQILFKAYGYIIPIGTMAEYTLLALGVAMIGAVIPGVLASRVNLRDALVFYGLKTGRIVRVKAGPTIVALAARSLLAKPWKLVGLAISIALVWGVAAGASASTASINDSMESYWNLMDYDAVIVLTPTSMQVKPDYKEALQIISGNPLVSAYQETVISNGRYLEATDAWTCVAAVLNGTQISFKALSGRLPAERGEAAVSQTITVLFHLKIGDTIKVRLNNGSVAGFRIVGVVPDKCNSYVIVVVPQDYEHITGRTVGTDGRVIYVKYIPGTDPASATQSLVGKLNKDPTIYASATTRDKLLENSRQDLRLFSGVTTGFTLVSLVTGLGVVLSLAIIDASQRRREISILQAIGTTRGRITLQYMIELVIAALASLPLVLIIGFLIARASLKLIQNALGYIPLRYTPITIISPAALIAFLLVFILGSLLTRRYVGKINVVEALRADQ